MCHTEEHYSSQYKRQSALRHLILQHFRQWTCRYGAVHWYDMLTTGIRLLILIKCKIAVERVTPKLFRLQVIGTLDPATAIVAIGTSDFIIGPDIISINIAICFGYIFGV
jgi:hypothetical protein